MSGDCWMLIIGIGILCGSLGYCNGRLHEIAKWPDIINEDEDGKAEDAV